MRIASVFGIEISVSLSWIFVFAFVAWSLADPTGPLHRTELGVASRVILGVIGSILFFASVLAHELAHSLVARRRGVRVRGIMLFIFGAEASLFQSVWFVESFWTQTLIIFVIRTRRFPFFKSRPGKWLLVLTLTCVAIGTIVLFPPFGAVFGFTAPPADFWFLLVLMTVTYLLLVEVVKRRLMRRLLS